MMPRLLLEILSYAILFPAIVGAVRFKSILKSYRPFVYLIWGGLLNEIISTVTITIFHGDTINNNIYALFDYVMVMLLFICWDEQGQKKNLLRVLLILGVLTWIGEYIIFKSIHNISSYFRIVRGVILVYLSIEELNNALFNEIRRSYKSAKLIICLGFIIVYTYTSVIEIFVVLNVELSSTFFSNMYVILAYINLFTNLFFGLAMLWVPTKRQFTLPY